MVEQVELAIVGAGPAGMGAAQEAAALQINAVVIDGCALPGGQYYKQLSQEFQVSGKARMDPDDMITQFSQCGIRLISNTDVWGIFPQGDGFLLCMYSPERSERRLFARKVILATGAYDRPVPFPGWALPGVITAGAAMNMIKSQRILPGKRILLSGTGPLQLVLAAKFIQAGADVIGLLEANHFPWHAALHLAAFYGQWERLLEGWHSWRTIKNAGLGMQWNRSVLRVEGNETLRSVWAADTGGDGIQQKFDVDVLCLGYGFLPSAQLAIQIGCRQVYSETAEIWLAYRTPLMESSVDGVFLAGDCAGTAGKDLSYWEGRLASLGAARQLGYAAKEERHRLIDGEIKKQRRFIDVLNRLFPFPAEMYDLITDDTVICRCEDITVSTIKQKISEGASTSSAMKILTRAGMGYCQGRTCGSTVVHLIEKEMNMRSGNVRPLVSHPPVVPVPVSGLIDDADEDG